MLRALPARRMTPRRESLAWAAAAAAASLARHVPFAAGVFEGDLAGQVNALYEGLIQKNWLRAGFLELGGRPMRLAIPTVPVTGEVYAHHPPLVHWATWPLVATFGLREWAIRAPAIAMAAATGALLAVLARRHLGRAGAIAAIAVFATLPLELTYGAMTNYEAPVMLLGLAGLLVLPSARDGNGWRPAAAIVLLATAFDWGGMFLVPAYLAHERVATGRWPRLTAATTLAAGAATGAATYVAVLLAWTPSFGQVFGALVDVADYATLQAPTPIGDRVARIAAWLPPMFGWPGLAATIVGIVAAAKGLVPRSIAAAIACWSLVAVVNLAIFSGHAALHDYWWLYFAPVAVLAPAALVARTSGVGAGSPAPTPDVLLATAIVAAVAVGGVHESVRRHISVDRAALAADAEALRSSGDGQELRLFALAGPYPDVALFYDPSWVLPVPEPAGPAAAFARSLLEGKLSVRAVSVVSAGRDSKSETLRPLTPDEVRRLGELGFRERPHPLGSRVVLHELVRPS
ncbi:MAG TPA: glycosyltransferase family 39 protein [Planctomycetota bacterium]|nr:glycosyltransferase family 39 protein [Planctomycetota bacterium]